MKKNLFLSFFLISTIYSQSKSPLIKAIEEAFSVNTIPLAQLGQSYRRDNHRYFHRPLTCLWSTDDDDVSFILPVLTENTDDFSKLTRLIESNLPQAAGAIAYFLKETSSSINMRIDENLNTLLTYSASKGSFNIVKYLLRNEHIIQVNDETSSGENALVLAAKSDSPHKYMVIELLLKSGADFKAKNSRGITALGLIIKGIYTDTTVNLEDKNEKIRKIIEFISSFRLIDFTDVEEVETRIESIFPPDQKPIISKETIENAMYFLKLAKYRFVD